MSSSIVPEYVPMSKLESRDLPFSTMIGQHNFAGIGQAHI
jgi:hypothetical protein